MGCCTEGFQKPLQMIVKTCGTCIYAMLFNSVLWHCQTAEQSNWEPKLGRRHGLLQRKHQKPLEIIVNTCGTCIYAMLLNSVLWQLPWLKYGPFEAVPRSVFPTAVTRDGTNSVQSCCGGSIVACMCVCLRLVSWGSPPAKAQAKLNSQGNILLHKSVNSWEAWWGRVRSCLVGVWGLMLSRRRFVIAHSRQACIIGVMQAPDIHCWHWV